MNAFNMMRSEMERKRNYRGVRAIDLGTEMDENSLGIRGYVHVLTVKGSQHVQFTPISINGNLCSSILIYAWCQ